VNGDVRSRVDQHSSPEARHQYPGPMLSCVSHGSAVYHTGTTPAADNKRS
jgi:hypothetical protein